MTKTEAVANAAIYILRHLNTHGDLNIQRETQALLNDIGTVADAPAATATFLAGSALGSAATATATLARK